MRQARSVCASNLIVTSVTWVRFAAIRSAFRHQTVSPDSVYA
ncbi:hypothetical protein C8N36_13223 [Pelagimonas varians]|uniref:Uncharacterized protein n=1 Tax=Pelagimonas varians TaxID=696760 RepID=A0A238L5G6_9RHOB|nr:hypothetical protein C8N36_13223 [Pelagimonas varians]SMX50353.1 hypothetical protein PEV8663_04610 [Pelagimonas varians]